MLHVFFNGSHQVGNQVIAFLGHHVNGAEGLVSLVAQPDKPVVGNHGKEYQYPKGNKYPQHNQSFLVYMIKNNHYSRIVLLQTRNSFVNCHFV
jgi:hypothetical protein